MLRISRQDSSAVDKGEPDEGRGVFSVDREQARQAMARRVRSARRACVPRMYQAEAASLFGLSQSAYSRLENGETQSWKAASVDGAASLLGMTREQVRTEREGDSKQTDIDDLMAAIDGLAAQIAEVHGLLLNQLGR